MRTSLAARGSITGSEAITCNRRETMARSGPQAAVAGAVSAAYLSLSISSPGFAQGAPDLNTLTTQQAAADVCGGKLTSKALVKAALDRAKAKPELNAFITLDGAGAIKAAAAFDTSRKKGACKPLGGVPVVIKDNIEVAGPAPPARTPPPEDFVPNEAPPLLAKIGGARAAPIAQTPTH